LEFVKEASDSSSELRKGVLHRDGLRPDDLPVHEPLSREDFQDPGQSTRVKAITFSEAKDLVETERSFSEIGEDGQLPR
jgi:hypothetical protein